MMIMMMMMIIIMVMGTLIINDEFEWHNEEKYYKMYKGHVFQVSQ